MDLPAKMHFHANFSNCGLSNNNSIKHIFTTI